MPGHLKKPFHKPALSPPDLLVYYRLLVYMRPFQRTSAGPPTIVPGTTFADVLGLYEFDRELRLLFLNAIERVEVALRCAIVSQVAVSHGPHFFLQPQHFERLSAFVEFHQTACATCARTTTACGTRP